MTPLLHSLHIGTLATWLSVAGLGTVAVIAPNKPAPAPRAPKPEIRWISEDFTLGEPSPPAATPPADSLPAASPPADTPPDLPAPPDLPETAALMPLPELPELTAAAAASPARAEALPAAARVATRDAGPRTAARKPASSAAPAGQAGGGSGQSNAARLAAGSMPSPDYPAEARRLGQTGTLVVEFTVDASGRVLAAWAKSPSPWPLLNQAAVSSVRRWKFPPGPVMQLQRPIVFQLR